MTHFVCQPTAPLPHKYPLIQRAEKTHGAVSDYEAYNMGNKAHTKFPPPGFDISSASEESLPLCQPPAPMWKHQISGPDPTLTLTPDRTVSQVKQKHFYPVPMHYQPGLTIVPDPDLCVTPEKYLEKQKSSMKNVNDGSGKFKQKVRFDMPNSDSDKENSMHDSTEVDCSLSPSGKRYSPADYSGNDFMEDEDKDAYFDQNDKYAEQHTKMTKQYQFHNSEKGQFFTPLQEQKHLEDVSLKKTTKSGQSSADGPGKAVNPKTNELIMVRKENVTRKEIGKTGKKVSKSAQQESDAKPAVISGDKSQLRKVRVTRESEARPTKNTYNFPFNDGCESKLEYEHVFNRPEYNSTLRVRKELEHLKECTVDIDSAVEKKLAKTEGLLSNIQEKAAMLVNHQDNKYSGLVSLEVQLEDIRNAKEKEKSAMVKASKPKQTESKGREPDIMEYFTNDLQQEFLDLTLPSIKPPNELLQLASNRSTFDLYKHNRVWNGNSNFKCS